MATSYDWEGRGTGGTHASDKFISVLTVPNPSGSGTLNFNVRDEMARGQIQSIIETISGGVHFIGICTDALTDGGTTNPVHISGATDTVTANDGDIVIVRKDSYTPAAKQDKEFIWAGGSSGKWNLFGEVNIDDFGDLAWTNVSQLQTASDVVTGTTLDKSAATSTGAVSVLDSVSAALTSGTVTFSGSITPGTIEQGTKSTSPVYGHNADFATAGVVVSPNDATETLTFTNAGTGSATLINDTATDADTTILSDVTYGAPSMATITNGLTASVGTEVTITPTAAYLKTVDTASKVNIEKKSS